MCAKILTKTLPIVLCLLIGCVAPQWKDPPRLTATEKPLTKTAVANGAEKPSKKTKPSPTVAKRTADESTPKKTATAEKIDAEKNEPDDESITRLYEELKAVRDVDAELYQQLRQDLKQIDPAIQPYIVKNIRAALAIREKRNAASAETQIDHKPHKLRQPRKSQQDERLTHSRTSKKNSLREKADSSSRSRRSLRDSHTEPKRLSNRSNERVEVSRAAAEEIVQSIADVDDEHIDDHVDHVADAQRIDSNTQIWQEQLRRAIRTLEQDMRADDDLSPSVSADYESKQMALRMLYLVAGRADDAAAKLSNVDKDRKEFWSAVLKALDTYMDTNGIPVADRRAERTLEELRLAISSLSNMSQLHVDNLVFCNKVESYGRFSDMKPYNFTADQEVLLYVEVDNFAATELKDGHFKTEMEGSYQIIDSAGRRVADHTFPTEEEICRNRRRDYFIPYRMWLPKQIKPGEYTLQLTVEDKIGEKFGQASIDFAIKR